MLLAIFRLRLHNVDVVSLTPTKAHNPQLIAIIHVTNADRNMGENMRDGEMKGISQVGRIK